MDLGPVAAHAPRAVTGEARESAVLAPVLEREGDPHLLFIRRADDLGEHPGQMSFPGGGREPEDADLLATALREADEEVGMAREEPAVVGRLDDIRTVTDYSVRPFVARVPDRPYRPTSREVAAVVVLPVAALTDPENYEYERREHPEYGSVLVHYFHVGDHTVWGATGRILVQLLELATDWTAAAHRDGHADGDVA
jgi:8-oxo-dGTP pyrophosphatase MutT (NUDIX family)